MRGNTGFTLLVLAGTTAAAVTTAPSVAAQRSRPGCTVLCAPPLDLMPALLRSHVFGGTPARTYVHRLTLFAMVGFVATGLPRTGDDMPQGRRFLDDARPTSLVVGLALPITPRAR